jgi:Protein of unknown function (DUF2789)
MDDPPHDLPKLFRQLGLADTPDAIDAFVASHRPLVAAVDLAHASFWSPAQRAFLQAALADDADWCVAVDRLSASLR